jgi:ubiquinone/menaquinone biosynthesis C-methylase UbiE
MGLYSEVIFPWLIDRVEGPEIYALRERCVRTAAGNVLEIGFGTGKTLPYYGADVRSLTVVEPSAGMGRRARNRIRESSVPVELIKLPGERLPFADATFDGVVVTMTLCTVSDQAQVLAEIQRVLKPGGRYHFLEHVASCDPKARRTQQRLNSLSRLVGCGCNLNRETEQAIVRSGFLIDEIERLVSKDMPIHPELYPIILGVARNPRETADTPLV